MSYFYTPTGRARKLVHFCALGTQHGSTSTASWRCSNGSTVTYTGHAASLSYAWYEASADPSTSTLNDGNAWL